jgi:hypothetical protein
MPADGGYYKYLLSRHFCVLQEKSPVKFIH